MSNEKETIKLPNENLSGTEHFKSVTMQVAAKRENIDMSKQTPGNLIMLYDAAPDLKIRYHKELFPFLPEVVQYGNFVDLYNAESRILKAGEFTKLNLGISIECPKGFWFQLVPRSSTFEKYGIIQTNSFGVVDTKYCGDDDIIKVPVYAMRDTIIPANERICQFRLVQDINFTISTVDKLRGENRGGFGSSGRK